MNRKTERRWKDALVLGGVLAAAGVALAVNIPAVQEIMASRSRRRLAGLPEYPAYTAGQRVLMVSPHPDDESLAAGAQIVQAVRNGAEVFIVWITNGDGFTIDSWITERTDKAIGGVELGRTRMREAQKAGATLGVGPAHQYFLGFPDGATLKVWEAGLEDGDRVVESPATHETAVPYEGTLHPGQPYTANNMRRNINELLDTIKPDVVLLPSQHDMHHDHHATNLFWKQVLGQRGELPKARYWLVHGGLEWPLPKGLLPHFPLLVSPRGRHLPWRQFRVEDQDQLKKLQAVFAHETQVEMLLNFMLSFCRANELVTLED